MRRRLLFFGALGWISVVWSEALFWGRFPPDEPLVAWPARWIVYTAAAYLAWRLSERHGVRGFAGHFLVGAVFGYLIEGAVAAQVYATFPLGLVFTPLAWHAPLTVVIGWWIVPRLLGAVSLRLAALAVVVGLAAAAWSVGLADANLDEDANTAFGLASRPAYVVFVVVMMTSLALAYTVFGRVVAPGPLHVTSTERTLWGCVALAVAFWTVFYPWAPLCFAGPMLLVRRSLRRSHTTAASEAARTPAPAALVTATVAAIAASTLAYALVASVEGMAAFAVVVVIGSSAFGTIALFRSTRRFETMTRRPRRSQREWGAPKGAPSKTQKAGD
ncbi:MAG: hypothetical protein ACT4OX_00460 [Actinomycetota bacterium]